MNPGPALTVNGRTYSIPPTPIVGICLDGCEPAYLDEAAHLMPQLQAMIAAGTPEIASTRENPWPVHAADGSQTVHYEADILITDEGPRDLTAGLADVNDIITA